MGLSNNLGKLSNMITSTGSAVGIAQTSPAYTLDVTGTGRFTGTILAGATNGNIRLSGTTDGFIGVSTSTMYLTDWTTATKGMTINLTTGAATFSSTISAGAISTFYSGGAGTAGQIRLGYDSTAYWQIGRLDPAGTGSGNFQFKPNAGTSVFDITSAGNVGIGTSSPAYLLDLYAASGYTARLNGATYGGLILANAGTANSYFVGESTLLSIEHITAINLRTNNADRMRITSGGNVNIGDPTATGQRLYVSTSNSSTSTFSCTRNGGSNDFNVITLFGSADNNTSNYHILCATGGADKLYVYGNGNVVNINNSYGALSDITLKENIVDATPKLDDLLQLKVRNFNLIGDENKQIGFIAQEFEEVFPSMVDIDGKSGKKLIKTSVLVPMLVKAVQEQNQIIQELNERLNKAGL